MSARSRGRVPGGRWRRQAQAHPSPGRRRLRRERRRERRGGLALVDRPIHRGEVHRQSDGALVIAVGRGHAVEDVVARCRANPHLRRGRDRSRRLRLWRRGGALPLAFGPCCRRRRFGRGWRRCLGRTPSPDRERRPRPASRPGRPVRSPPTGRRGVGGGTGLGDGDGGSIIGSRTGTMPMVGSAGPSAIVGSSAAIVGRSSRRRWSGPLRAGRSWVCPAGGRGVVDARAGVYVDGRDGVDCLDCIEGVDVRRRRPARRSAVRRAG